MDQSITLTVKDLILFALGAAGTALLIYLILTLREVLLSVKQVRGLIEERRIEIDDILQKAPNIVDSVDQITGIAAKGVNGAYNGAMGLVSKIKGDDLY